MKTIIVTANLEEEVKAIRALEAKINELDELKKEWLEIENKQDNSEDSLAYPFGGWTDADKYQK